MDYECEASDMPLDMDVVMDSNPCFAPSAVDIPLDMDTVYNERSLAADIPLELDQLLADIPLDMDTAVKKPKRKKKADIPLDLATLIDDLQAAKPTPVSNPPRQERIMSRGGSRKYRSPLDMDDDMDDRLSARDRDRDRKFQSPLEMDAEDRPSARDRGRDDLDELLNSFQAPKPVSHTTTASSYSYDGSAARSGPPAPGEHTVAHSKRTAASAMDVDYSIYIDASSTLHRPTLFAVPASGILLPKEQVDHELASLQALVDAGFLLPEQLLARKAELQVAGKHLPTLHVPHIDYDRNLARAANRKASSGRTNRNVRVFVSSTFRDMEQEREALLKDAFPKLRALCAERGVFLSSVDLRWGITTEQSQDGNTINICLSEIDRCQPYFLCMLGHRYGWSHADVKSDALLTKTFKKASVNFPWVMQYQDRSVTELEVRHAALNVVNPPPSLTGASNYDAETATRVQSHALFYFNATPPKFTPDNPVKLGALKKEIAASGLQVQDYHNGKELSELVVDQMSQMIEADFPLSEAPTPLERERQAHIAFQDVRARVYIGRTDYFTAIDAHLTHSPNFGLGSDQSLTPIVVLGGSGLGKSALMANWVARWQDSHPSDLVIAHYIGCSALSTDLGRLLQRLLHEIKEHFGLQKEVPQKLNDLVQAFPDFLFAASQHGGVTIMLDALNQLEDRDNAHTLFWLPTKYPTNVKLVLSTLPGKCETALLSRGWKALTVVAMNQSERRSMVSEYMKQYGKTLTLDQLEMIVHARQSESPLFVRTLLEELRVFGSFEQLEAKITHYLTAQTPPALFELVFARLEQDFESASPGVVGKALTLLYASRRGLTEFELLSILKLPGAQWSPLYLALEESLISRSGFFSFFHDYMRQAVAARYLSKGQIIQFRTTIIQHFNPATALDAQAYSRRMEEVPFQLLQMANWAPLADWICTVANFVNLYSINEDYKFDLVRYWRECSDHHSGLVPQFVQSMRRSGDAKTYELAIKFLQDVASYEAAEQICSFLIDAVSTASGRSSVELAQAKATRAYLLRLRGQYKDAAALFEELLPVMESAYENQPNEQLGTIYNNMAELYRHQGRYDESARMFDRALDMRRKVFGSVSSELAQTLDLYGVLKQDMGQYDDAKSFFTESVRMREELLGVSHPDVGNSLRNLADLYLLMAKYEEAEPMYEKAKAIVEGVFGGAHPMVQQIVNSQAAMYQELGRYEEAKNAYSVALKNQEQALGSEHALVALTLNDLGVLLIRQKNYAEAESTLNRALAIRRKVFGSATPHPDIASTVQNIGALYRETKKYKEALECFESAHSILVQNFGREHADVCNALKQMAAIHLLQNNLEKAAGMYAEALALLPKILGEMTLDVAVLCNDYAILEFKRGRNPTAEQLYQRALKIYIDRVGEAHLDTAQAQYNIGEFYYRTKQKQKAIPHYEAAMETFRSLYGPQHQKVQNILTRLAS